jgi:hypothetical protein
MHHALRLPAIVLSSVALFACAAPQEAPKPAPEKAEVQHTTSSSLKPLEKKKFGGEITEKESTPLTELLKQPGKYSAKMVRTEGVVSAVCKSMGCWMELGDAKGHAHVKMSQHSFFVPRDASGHRAIVQGKVITQERDHCTEESEKALGSVAKVEIEATAVEFID